MDNPDSREQRIKALFYLHIAVFLWGFTAILGKLISYNSLVLVWHRMCLTAIIYFLIPVLWKYLRAMPWKHIFLFLGIGLIVCAHWLTFYGSIKLGNSASVTLACLGSASCFAAVLEPLLSRKRIKIMELFLGLFVLCGIFMIYIAMPEDKEELNTAAAIFTGVLSAFLAALFTVLNKMNIKKANVLAISALEMLGGGIAMCFIIPIFIGMDAYFVPEWNAESGNYDLLWILLLVLVCTNFTFYLGARSLNHLSAFTANLSVNLEPVYGIVLGAVIFHENKELNGWFYAGASLILISVFLQSFVEYFQNRNKNEDNTELVIRE